jgi:hypothetical protein
MIIAADSIKTDEKKAWSCQVGKVPIANMLYLMDSA